MLLNVGSDNLQSEYFKLAGSCIVKPITNIFNSLVAHSYMPYSMMKVIIVPVVKRRDWIPAKGHNRHYRPIASPVFFPKLFEMCLLRCYEPFLHISANQFGYKKLMGTELAVYSVKQVVHHYLRHNIPVHACLDGSKAFDLVNHFTLLENLCARNLPASFVNLLIY